MYALSVRHCGPHSSSLKSRSSIGVIGCYIKFTNIEYFGGTSLSALGAFFSPDTPALIVTLSPNHRLCTTLFMKLSSEFFPYKHIVNLYENNYLSTNALLTSMIRTCVL